MRFYRVFNWRHDLNFSDCCFWTSTSFLERWLLFSIIGYSSRHFNTNSQIVSGPKLVSIFSTLDPKSGIFPSSEVIWSPLVNFQSNLGSSPPPPRLRQVAIDESSHYSFESNSSDSNRLYCFIEFLANVLKPHAFRFFLKQRIQVCFATMLSPM